MDLQTIFYILGIIFMLISLGLLIAIVVALLFVKKKISEIHKGINDRIESVKNLTSEPAGYARGAGAVAAGILSFVLRRMAKR